MALKVRLIVAADKTRPADKELLAQKSAQA